MPRHNGEPPSFPVTMAQSPASSTFPLLRRMPIIAGSRYHGRHTTCSKRRLQMPATTPGARHGTRGRWRRSSTTPFSRTWRIWNWIATGPETVRASGTCSSTITTSTSWPYGAAQ